MPVEQTAHDSRPWILCDCPFYPEFQELFDKHVRSVFITEVVNKGVDAVEPADVAAVISGAGACEGSPARAGDFAAVVSHQHAPFRGAELELLPNLRVVSNHGVGYGHIDAEYLLKRGVPLGNTPGAASAPTAELGAALVLASARNLVASARRAADPRTTGFDPYWYGRRVTGATLGLVGFGQLAQQMAAKMRGFEMQVLYCNRTRRPELETELGVTWCAGGLEEVLRRSDFVVLCVASAPETRGMIGAEQLRAMKRTATLVNIARGDIVVQADLVEALRGGAIAGAALDVTAPEPLPRDHPLLHMDNVIVTTHIGSATKEDRRKMAEMCLENLLAGLEGRELPYAVHQGRGVKRKASEGKSA